MKVFKFFVLAENGFHACIASIHATDIIQAIYRYEKTLKKSIKEIIKIEQK